jgi:hypothetical protein
VEITLHKVVDEADDISIHVTHCQWQLVFADEAEGKSISFLLPCVSPILSALPLHLEIIDIRPYYSNVDLVPRENASGMVQTPHSALRVRISMRA